MSILLSENNSDFTEKVGESIPAILQQKSKRVLMLAFGIVISAALIFYLFKEIDFNKFKSEFKNFNLWYSIPLTGLLALIMLLRAYRSRYLIPREYRESADTQSLLEAVLVGFTANSFLPMRAGEIVRPVFLQKRIQLPFASGLASIFTERIFDLVALLTIAPLVLSRVPDPPQFLLTTSAALRVISGFGLLGVFLCAFCGSFTLKFAERLTSLVLPKKIQGILLKMLEQVIQTLGAVKNIKELFFILIYSFGVWVVTGYYYQLAGAMLGIELSYFSGLLTAITIAFAVAAPSSPGFIGTFQFGCSLTLTSILHYSQEFSLAYGLSVHLVQTVSLLLVTVLALALSGKGVRSVIASATP